MRLFWFSLLVTALVSCSAASDPSSATFDITADSRGKLLLGTIQAERVGVSQQNPESEGRVREVISHELSAATGSVIIDGSEKSVPQEQDRQELARNGVVFIIKGQTSRRNSTNMNSVFLQAINTESGHVAAATAGRSKDIDRAAQEAASRLALELLDRDLLNKKQSEN